MASIQTPKPVKLICGMISADIALFDRARLALEASYGPVDLADAPQPFDLTHYYDAETGSPLFRTFVAFEHLIDPGELAAIKIATNELEAQFAREGKEKEESWTAEAARPTRPINLDPGYVTLAKLVLASMKDFAHRVYLRDGVYAEVTLQYRDGWQALPWTFPDYKAGRYDAFLTAAREELRRQGQEDRSV